MDSDGALIEVMDITAATACEVEISGSIETHTTINSDHPVMITEDQQMLKEEIKEEEIEDANVTVDMSQQGKRLLLKVCQDNGSF